MIELTAAEKLAALVDGLDLQLRAMFMAGFAGQPIPRSNPLGFIKEVSRERGWDLSSKWTSPTNSGLYTYVKNFVDGMKVPGDDLMQAEFLKGLKSIYYAAGEESSTSDKWAEGIKNGEKDPLDLKGILTNFAKRKALNYKSKVRTRSRKEEEGAYDIGDLTTPASGGGNRTMITDAILSGISSNASDEFIGWLKGLTKEMSPGAGKLMSAYLDLILRGEAESDVEALEKLNASGEFNIPNPSYLGKVKKDFADTAADLLSGATKTRNPQLQRMRDMLSDASFLDELSKGHVPGTRAAKLNGQPRPLSAADYMAELEKASKFERGVSVSLDELPEELQENVDNPPESVLDLRDEMEGKAAMFERGVPADPTKNMSAEDAAEWERQNREHADQFKTASGRRLSWGDGDRTAPWTPWGPAQYGTEIMRGVRVYGTAGHGGMAVAQGVARKLLTPAALKMGEFANGYYWYEEDAAIEIPFYERPEWFRKLQNRDMSEQERARSEASLRRWSPRYFTMLEQGVQLAPKLTPGMTLSVLKPISFGKGKFTMNVGDTVRVTEVRSGNMVVDFGGNLFRIPVRYYLDDDAYVAPSAKTASKTATSMMERLQLLSAFQVLTSGNPTGYGIPRKDALAVIEKITGKSLPEDAKPPVSKSLDQYMNWLEESGKTASDSREAEWNGRSMTAAAGLYGFTKSAEKSCTGAAGKLAKYATKLAKELYTKDADTAPFMEEHAKRGSKTARMLRNAMADVGPGPAPKTKTAASKSGMGLYGFKDSTAKLAMNACSELHQAAGHLAADLAMKFGEKHEDGVGFLKKHAKAAKCAFSDLILDSYPSAPVKVSTPKKAHLDPTVDEILAWDRAVGNRMATSFMASAEDEGELEVEVDTDVEAEDLISSWGKTAFDMVRTAGTYQEYVERKKKKGEKPMSESDWESRVYGQLAKGRAHPRDQKKEAPTAEGKVTRPAPGKKWPKYEGERTWEKNYRAPAQHVMGAYGLKDEDAEELTKYSRDKPHNTFQKVSPQKLMAEFLRNAKPETKERMKGMSPKDFMIMLRSMTADEPVVEA